MALMSVIRKKNWKFLPQCSKMRLSPLFSSTENSFSPLPSGLFFVACAPHTAAACRKWPFRLLVYDLAIIYATQHLTMLHPATCARSAESFDWSPSPLGAPATWPAPLRLAADLMFNSPLPMLLAWGPDRLVLFNDAYAELAGPVYGRVPGGSVPPVQPPPLAAAGAALDRAWQGEPGLHRGAALTFVRPGGRVLHDCDLYLTPVRGADGAVAGVLCALAPAMAAAAGDDGDATMAILVVEDNLDSQYLVCEMLRAFGHDADGVGHPDDALTRLAAKRYDVLFTDVSLPGMSGVELARRALGDNPALKVIFASGYGDTLLRHLDFPYQSLQKPYEIDQLQAALDACAGQRRA